MTQPNREPKSAESVQDGPEGLARYFHDTYERLAPHFGYETREETRAFDPTTPNGRLMISVCAHAMGSKWMRPTYGPTSPETEHVEPEGGAFQARVAPWMDACFGPEISGDKVERGDRLLEEVFELLQSGGYDPARVPALRDYVWGRDVGEPGQEVGGVMVTLAAYCIAFGLDMRAAGETELARIWTKVETIRAKQAAKPTGSALPVASPPPEGEVDALVAEAFRPIISPPREASPGKMEWEEIVSLFERNGLPPPPWRLRDVLVGHLVWARYGDRLASALSSRRALSREEVARIISECVTVKREDFEEDEGRTVRVNVLRGIEDAADAILSGVALPPKGEA